MIGGEATIDDGSIKAGMWIEWARKFSALCFEVEHRFYGKSHPTPYNKDNFFYNYPAFRCYFQNMIKIGMQALIT